MVIHIEIPSSFSILFHYGFTGGTTVKNPPANAGDTRDVVLDPWVGKIPWRRKWQPTPVFLPGKFHGQRSQVDYSIQGYKESDMTEHSTAAAISIVVYYRILNIFPCAI